MSSPFLLQVTVPPLPLSGCLVCVLRVCFAPLRLFGLCFKCLFCREYDSRWFNVSASGRNTQSPWLLKPCHSRVREDLCEIVMWYTNPFILSVWLLPAATQLPNLW